MHIQDYSVQRPDDHELMPEETLADAASGLSIVEIPMSRNVFRFFYIGVALALAALIVQSFHLQISQGKHFAAVANQSRLNQYPVPALRGIIYDRNGKPLVENVPVFDLVAVRSELLKANLQEYIPILEENKQNAVFVVKRDISKEEAIRIQGQHIPGLYVVSYARRQYLYGPALAQVVGYTAQITADELAQDRDGNYQHNDRVGRLGLEATYEEKLHGALQSVALDPASDHQSIEATPGQDIQTNLDVDIQQHLYQAIHDIFRSSGVVRGATIVQDVHTGAILGMISMPTFDPNGDITNAIEDKNKPLFNRAISGRYPPGSTIKPLYALAGLNEKIVDPSTQVYANGGIQVQSEIDPSVQYTFRDWKVHGWTDIRKAIAWSVDVYFYALGGGLSASQTGSVSITGLGIDRIERYLKSFLVDKKTGIDLPAEAVGFVPSKEWKKATKNDAWYIGDTYNISIGQGDLVVTPLWISMYASALANGGKLMKPEIAKQNPQVLGTVFFDDATWRVVREGMRQTVTDGTAQLLKDLPKPVAAKTGTAQITGRGLNSLFIVYGPTDNPDISLTILVENIPQSQSLAMQVAKQFLSWYFSRQ